jgi:hypothetical protein
LDYYVARYYDLVVGRFLSADTVEDNIHGMGLYEYVGDKPETKTDPTSYYVIIGGVTWDDMAPVIQFDPIPVPTRRSWKEDPYLIGWKWLSLLENK